MYYIRLWWYTTKCTVNIEPWNAVYELAWLLSNTNYFPVLKCCHVSSIYYLVTAQCAVHTLQTFYLCLFMSENGLLSCWVFNKLCLLFNRTYVHVVFVDSGPSDDVQPVGTYVWNTINSISIFVSYFSFVEVMIMAILGHWCVYQDKPLISCTSYGCDCWLIMITLLLFKL